MQLWPFLEEKLILSGLPFISVTGGGGKTTFLIKFGDYLKKRGKRVLLTTTTKLASPETEDYSVDEICSSPDEITERGRKVLLASWNEEKRKLENPGEDAIRQAAGHFDAVLSEADGSKRRPVKVHTSRDPVIHPLSTSVVAVLGIWGIGKRTGEAAFGDNEERVIDREYLQELIFSPEGLLKGMSGKTLNAVLFNGGDVMTPCQREIIESLVFPENVSVYIVSEREGVLYDAVQSSC